MRLRSREYVLEILSANEGPPTLATVSGILTTRPGLMLWVDRHLPEIGVITTKSYQVGPNAGYREPILCEPEPGCFGNAVGLANPGVEAGLAELKALRSAHDLRALLNVSIAGASTQEFIELARAFGEVADLLELNLSCPHARDGYGTQAAPDAEAVGRIVEAVRSATDRPVVAKLSPNNTEIAKQAVAAIQAGADGLVAINTVGPDVYREPSTGTPILSNPGGGGRSGTWVREIARDRIAAIRSAVGPGVPIVGMGGVASADDVRGLLEAGATVVGLGSVFARLAGQDRMVRYTQELVTDLKRGTNEAVRLLDASGGMRYTPCRITAIDSITPDLAVFTLDREMPFSASQYAFLFVPGGGEKPFSILGGDPLSFLVRRRGAMTEALFRCGIGDHVLVRGPYGASAPVTPGVRSVVVAGGTGCAVAPQLVRELRASGEPPRVLFGVARAAERRLAELVEGTTVTCVEDRGRPARVLDQLQDPSLSLAGVTVYAVGPVPFMRLAAERAIAGGASAQGVFVSLETPTRCGVGICGACEVGGSLLCRRGTFVDVATVEQTGWPDH